MTEGDGGGGGKRKIEQYSGRPATAKTDQNDGIRCSCDEKVVYVGKKILMKSTIHAHTMHVQYVFLMKYRIYISQSCNLRLPSGKFAEYLFFLRLKEREEEKE